MSDFSSSIGSNISSVNSSNTFSTGTDKDRSNFLKGLKTTTSGQKEDPTYLGFRLLFDFGLGARIDEETFLPISPLLCSDVQMPNNGGGQGMDLFTMSKQVRNNLASSDDTNSLANVTSDLYYLTAQGYLDERRSDNDENYNDGVSSRCSSLLAFQNMIKSVNTKSPWFIKSIDGLDKLLSVPISRSYIGNSTPIKNHRSGVLSFNCMESIDLRITAMADFYRKAVYDPTFNRVMLPNNLRKFRMWIIVTELRNMHLSQNLSDVLNPFNNSAVSNVASMVSSIAQTSGINNSTPSNPNVTKPESGQNGVYDTLSKLEPYIFMYQLDNCEFDFDEYSHIPSSLSNEGNNKPTENRFKIHVGRITEKKTQYNILSDLIKNQSSFSPILIADSWDMSGSNIPSTAYNADNNTNLFSQLANNFINNSVSSVIQQFNPIVSKAVLGNVYGTTLSSIANLANSAQSLANGISTLQSPFMDSRPQSQGLGGPGQRVYPSITEDVYGDVKPSYFSNTPGSVYPGGTGYQILPYTNEYPSLITGDLGLPTRVYPNIISDLYPNDPGTDLGVPNRVYPAPNVDEYPTVPGNDLGLPGRVYPNIISDQYPNDPGSDLGVPSRVYPAPNIDEYPTIPTPDLGLPGRVYPNIISDQYPNDPGSDLGVPSRVYPAPNIDEYPTIPTPDLGLPGRVYPSIISDQYPNDPGSELGTPGRVYQTPNIKEYPTIPTPDLGLPGRDYPSITARVYPTGITNNIQSLNSNVYPDLVTGELGLPGRDYPGIIDNEYKKND